MGVDGPGPRQDRRDRGTLRGRRVRRATPLVDATADALPWPPGTVDVVVAVNSVQLWDPPAGSLARIRQVLTPAGRLLIGLSEHAVRSDASTVPADVDSWLVAELTAAGFLVERQAWEPGGNGRELLVVARPGS